MSVRRRRRRVSCVALVALVGTVLVACGPTHPSYQLGPPPTTSTTMPLPVRHVAASTGSSVVAAVVRSTTSAGPTSSTIAPKPWVAATGNLAGLPSECGNLSFVTARPDGDGVIAGVALHGLYVSTGGANGWQPLGSAKGSAVITNRMSSVVYDPTNPAVFWEAGLYNGSGVYRTSDGGATFSALGDIRHIDMVAVDLADPARSTMLAGMHESNVLYRSKDGGRTWTDISTAVGAPADVGFAASVHVVDQSVHLLGTRNGAKAGVYRTADGGGSWMRTWNTPVVGRMLVAKDGAWYWLLENGNGVIKSVDAGLTWKRVGGAGRIAPTATSLVVLPDGRLATWGASIVTSADGGVTWKAYGSGLPYSPWGMTYSAAQKAFYVWRFDCFATGENPVPADAIMRMDAATL